jgi:hypothetical protein
MVASERAVLRAVILPSDRSQRGLSPTGRLLSDLGINALPANSPDEARQLLSEGLADLLVVDVAGSVENALFAKSLGDLPVDQLPREISIFTDNQDIQIRALRTKLAPAHVHIFLKPLHVHGLLGILRQMSPLETAPA